MLDGDDDELRLLVCDAGTRPFLKLAGEAGPKHAIVTSPGP